MPYRRFIFNNDGTNILGANPPQGFSPDYVRSFVSRVANSQITTFLICSHAAMPYYPSRHEREFMSPIPGADPADLSMPSAEGVDLERNARFAENLGILRDANVDIVSMCLHQARANRIEAGISIRMNDLHFADPSTDLPRLQSDFWRENPKLRVGDHPGWHASGALNYARPEVRKFMLHRIAEVCERFAPDVLELDFMRFPVYFPQGTGESHIDLMTQFVATAREISRATGLRHGRPVLLTARLPATEAQNRAIGIDPAAWVRRRLIDFVTVSTFYTNDPALPFHEFRELIQNDNFPVYATIDSGMYQPRQIMTHGMYRGLAAYLFDIGADGVSLFNFFFDDENYTTHGHAHIGPHPQLLHEIGNPETLSGRNCICPLGVSLSEYHIKHHGPLPATLTAAPATFKLHLPKHSSLHPPAGGLMVLRLDHEEPVTGTLNGEPLDFVCDEETAGMLGLDTDVQPGQAILVAPVTGDGLAAGDRALTLSCPTAPATLLRADLALDFGEGESAGFF